METAFYFDARWAPGCHRRRGGLGTGAAKALQPFGVHPTGIRRSHVPHDDFDAIGAMADLDRVLTQTDILVLAAPLTEDTRALIGAVQLASLPTHAGIVNIGRGELIDQAALISALKAKRLGGAILDVQEREPVPANDPIWTAPNLLLTPHVSATDSVNFARDTLAVLQQNLEDIAAGCKPPNVVDIKRGY